MNGAIMKISVLGGDGYCGWATALYLSRKGHTVSIVDNFARRQWDHELGVQTLTPIRPMTDRLRVWRDLTGLEIEMCSGDITDYDVLSSVIQSTRPDAVVHFAEQRARAVFDDRPQARGLHAGQQRRGDAQPAVRPARVGARLPPCEARDDGRVRDAEHRYRRGFHRDRAQRSQGPPAVSEATGFLLPPVEGARQPQHHVHVQDLGPARHGPQPGRGLRHVDRRGRPRRRARQSLRLRRCIRHGAESLLRAGRRRATRSRSTGRADRHADFSTFATPYAASSSRC